LLGYACVPDEEIEMCFSRLSESIDEQL